jgi:hypothetical protein
VPTHCNILVGCGANLAVAFGEINVDAVPVLQAFGGLAEQAAQKLSKSPSTRCRVDPWIFRQDHG